MHDENVPIACDMTDAPDTPEERLAEYRRLFNTALIDRDRTATTIRFRFRNTEGVESWTRDLAARETACCSFMRNTVTVVDNEVVWEATTIDDPTARRVLDLFYELGRE